MRAFYLIVVFLGSIIRAEATVITFDVNNVGGNRWEYLYTIVNDTLTQDILEFTIFFDPTNYQNLFPETGPADWDSIVAQPDIAIPADGFYDSLALLSGISPNTQLTGFKVSFDYLGNGTPGSQLFDIVDPLTFETLASGRTNNSNVSVPEPNLLLMLSLFVSFYFFVGKYKKRS